MFADIQPADVYERVESTRVMVAWLFGTALLALTALVSLNLYFVLQKRRLNRQFAAAVERMELWLSLVEMHYQRGADQKRQTAEDTKFVRDFLARAAKEGKLPEQALAELKAAVAAVPRKVVSELERTAGDPDSGLRKALGPGDSHHG